MRVAACILALATLAAVVDIAQESAARVRAAARNRLPDLVVGAVEDWEYGTYFGTGLAAAAVCWAWAAGLPTTGRWRRVARAAAAGGVAGAVAVGGGMSAIAGLASAVAGIGGPDRHQAEARWLVGTAVGGAGGLLVGLGLGVVRSVRSPTDGLP